MRCSPSWRPDFHPHSRGAGSQASARLPPCPPAPPSGPGAVAPRRRVLGFRQLSALLCAPRCAPSVSLPSWTSCFQEGGVGRGGFKGPSNEQYLLPFHRCGRRGSEWGWGRRASVQGAGRRVRLGLGQRSCSLTAGHLSCPCPHTRGLSRSQEARRRAGLRWAASGVEPGVQMLPLPWDSCLWHQAPQSLFLPNLGGSLHTPASSACPWGLEVGGWAGLLPHLRHHTRPAAMSLRCDRSSLTTDPPGDWQLRVIPRAVASPAGLSCPVWVLLRFWA